MVFYQLLFAFLIVAVVTGFVTNIIKMALKHTENMKRIEHGYPTLDGSKPKERNEENFIDMTERLQ